MAVRQHPPASGAIEHGAHGDEQLVGRARVRAANQIEPCGNLRMADVDEPAAGEGRKCAGVETTASRAKSRRLPDRLDAVQISDKKSFELDLCRPLAP